MEELHRVSTAIVGDNSRIGGPSTIAGVNASTGFDVLDGTVRLSFPFEASVVATT